MSSLLLSWFCNLWLFMEDATGVSVPLGVATQYLGFHSNQALSRVDMCLLGELLALPKACQVPFRGSRGKVGFLLRCCSGKGPHLALRGEYPGVS